MQTIKQLLACTFLIKNRIIRIFSMKLLRIAYFLSDSYFHYKLLTRISKDSAAVAGTCNWRLLTVVEDMPTTLFQADKIWRQTPSFNDQPRLRPLNGNKSCAWILISLYRLPFTGLSCTFIEKFLQIMHNVKL